MSEYIEFAVRVPKDEADSFIARFGKGNVRILGFLLGEEIVRCRDCKYMFDWAYGRMLCKMWADGGMDDDVKSVLYPTVKPDGFCAWGERRDDA